MSKITQRAVATFHDLDGIVSALCTLTPEELAWMGDRMATNPVPLTQGLGLVLRQLGSPNVEVPIVSSSLQRLWLLARRIRRDHSNQ